MRTPRESQARSSRFRHVRFLLPLIAVGFTLVAVEVAGRGVAALTHQERGMGFDPVLGWRPLPNVSKVGGIWGVTRPASSNSRGWRDVEHALEKPAGRRRLVAIGDSFTFGVDADDGERFTDALPGLVDQLEVINLGVAGYGPDQELLVLEREAFKYDPDVVLLTSTVLNDFTDIGYERLYSWPKPTFTLVGGHLTMTPPRLTWDIRIRNVSYAAEFLFQRVANEDYHPRLAPGFDAKMAPGLFEALLGRMAQVTAKAQVPLVAALAYAPLSEQPDYKPVAAAMTASFAKLGIPLLDVRALFAGRSTDPDTEFHSPVGRHWNRAGNLVVAEGVRDLLSRHGL